MKRRLFHSILFTVSMLVVTAGFVQAGEDLSDPDTAPSFEDRSRQAKPPRPTDGFTRALARRFNANETELTKLRNRGFGRTELTKMIIISRKARIELADIVKLRDKNTRLSEIAAKYNVDYTAVLDEAAQIRSELKPDNIREEIFQTPLSSATALTETSADPVIISTH